MYTTVCTYESTHPASDNFVHLRERIRTYKSVSSILGFFRNIPVLPPLSVPVYRTVPNFSWSLFFCHYFLTLIFMVLVHRGENSGTTGQVNSRIQVFFFSQLESKKTERLFS
ncbi:hypothetical protein COCSADRAFT_301754 [Bipolaris sorokiniana ND90Pr]|uniref:Uncharacterized protein n=1 Tax=Cochliobolus sativus (strain ND90Pr / ATCC 201652) TaxID=665912 RepID=M2SHP1_COCSN|nr:uncharacterized protein COCSADRAFT_301754 [Bipolaris sorokiniana ND90Pr]EMD66738.1 hypothetical protein COCSADRAFT_301754 [Bipolaris sorokiniana ND90Pr]